MLRKERKIIVITTDAVTSPDGKISAHNLVSAVEGIWNAGLPAELTMRIDDPDTKGIDYGKLREAMVSLTQERAQRFARDQPVVLGIGSIMSYKELELAIIMGPDFVVSFGSGVGGSRYREGPRMGQLRDPLDFVLRAHQGNTWAAPAIAVPEGLQLYMGDEEGVDRPDGIKIFPAGLYLANDAKELKTLLTPAVRHYGPHKNQGGVFMPTGSVDEITGPAAEFVINALGFNAVLGLSKPIEPLKKKATSDPGAYETACRNWLKVYGTSYENYAAKVAAKKG